ncbi:hypothetical protein DYB26_005432 [Aphanomyces astaci]|uniref:Fe2OG dioxygenase domain-containing protein n=2 Tax=Aphanomyces astaci TaxID=112090 RepID=A0A3R6ZC82_APHAT|nr:hypothetical protein DYB26_005432 [Aphanomyces astaci]
MHPVGIVSVLVAAVAGATNYPPYQVPSFDLNTITTDGQHALVRALETSGIVAVRGIPDFEATRLAYLHTATNCAASAHDLDQLLKKELVDGTQRRTFSMNMQGLNDQVAERCPAFAIAHARYASTIDTATAQFAKTLDGINKDLTSDLLAPIVQEGLHLDHFHAYAKPAVTTTNAPHHRLSLELHADAGLMIVFAKSHFFTETTNGKLEQATEDKAGGLVIELDGSLVRPTLKDDELYFMAGEGLQHWGQFGHKFHPVVHGMVMPADVHGSPEVVRAFAGRMLLLPAQTIMRNTGVTFGEYTKATTRHLKSEASSGEESVMSLACPVGRVLRASDSSCTLSIWSPGPGSTATKEECMRQCNIWGHADEAQLCLDMKCRAIRSFHFRTIHNYAFDDRNRPNY